MKDHTNDIILDIEGWHPAKQIVTKCLGQNIITSLHEINTSKVEEGCNNDNNDNDTNIFYEVIEAPNASDYHEPQPQNPNQAIGHPIRSWITKVSQS
jgi:hypothetical protein